MLGIAFVIVIFADGVLSQHFHLYPSTFIENAEKTADAIYQQLSPPVVAPEQFLGWSDTNPGKLAEARFGMRAPVPDAPSDEHFLLSGGLYQYLEYCPKYGCIAVELTRSGSLVHAYPYRPDQFESHQTVSLPYEEVFFKFTENMKPWGMTRLPDGDLIVVFLQWNTFPFAGGIARVRPDGSVAWFRHDYSHHWPRLLPDGNIVVPAMRIGGSHLSVPMPHGYSIDLECDGKIEEDIVRILNPQGKVLQEISVLDALLRSPYRGLLSDTPPCDPLHLNYVVPVTKGIEALYPDVSPDDFVVSLRNLSAFAILGRHDHRLKHLFTGTFLRQHSVQPLGQSATMLIFDNHGGDWKSGPSRFIAYDLVTHTERTLLHNPEKGGARFSDEAGNISVSPDLKRAIVTYSLSGRAYEVRLADGKILTAFNNLHDLRTVPAAGERRNHALAWFCLFTALYVH